MLSILFSDKTRQLLDGFVSVSCASGFDFLKSGLVLAWESEPSLFSPNARSHHYIVHWHFPAPPIDGVTCTLDRDQ